MSSRPSFPHRSYPSGGVNRTSYISGSSKFSGNQYGQGHIEYNIRCAPYRNEIITPPPGFFELNDQGQERAALVCACVSDFLRVNRERYLTPLQIKDLTRVDDYKYQLGFYFGAGQFSDSFVSELKKYMEEKGINFEQIFLSNGKKSNTTNENGEYCYTPLVVEFNIDPSPASSERQEKILHRSFTGVKKKSGASYSRRERSEDIQSSRIRRLNERDLKKSTASDSAVSSSQADEYSGDETSGVYHIKDKRSFFARLYDRILGVDIDKTKKDAIKRYEADSVRNVGMRIRSDDSSFESSDDD